MRRSNISFRSSIPTRASTIASVGVTSCTGCSRASNSSSISPTISSIRSSVVTRPAVPPYSSTTMAMDIRCWRISASSSSIFFDSGTKWAGRASSRTLTGQVPLARWRSTSLAYTTPITLSTVFSYAGRRLYPFSTIIWATSLNPSSTSTATMSMRGTMTSRTVVCSIPMMPRIICLSSSAMPVPASSISIRRINSSASDASSGCRFRHQLRTVATGRSSRRAGHPNSSRETTTNGLSMRCQRSGFCETSSRGSACSSIRAASVAKAAMATALQLFPVPSRTSATVMAVIPIRARLRARASAERVACRS